MKFLFFTLAILTMPLLVPSAGEAASPSDPGKTTDAHRISSFREYLPQAIHFQEKVRPAAKLLEEGLRAKQAGDAATAETKIRRGLAAADKILPELNRGYHDELHALRGFALEGLGQLSEAEAAFKKSLALKSGHPLILFRHALVLKNSGNCDGALKEFREVLWHSTQHGHEVLFELGECLMALGRSEEGLKVFQQAYERNHRFLPVLEKIVAARTALAESTSDPQKRAELEASLVNDLTALTQVNPDDRDSAIKLASLLLRGSDPLIGAKKLAQAENLVRRFAESSSFTDDLCVRLLFSTQLKRGNFKAAEETLTRGLKKRPDSELLKEAVRQLEIERGS